MIYNSILKDRSKILQDSFGIYKVQNQVVYAHQMEFNAVRQCNLSCRSCSHAAPIQKKLYYDPAVLKQDLEALASWWHVSWLNVLGGEPLLHPDLLRILQVARASGVADSVRVVTNGVLLDIISDNMLPYIDEIRVSLYPNQSKQNLLRINKGIAKLRRKNITVDVVESPVFREAFAQTTTANKKLIKKIYTTCRVAHDWKCIVIDNGVLYRCPQAIVYSEQVSELPQGKRGGLFEFLR